jgi:Na+(H+)/acetate symporter ActP
MTGFLLGIGLSAAFLLIVLLVAEPLRNLGRFTLADAVATRFEGRGLRGAIAVTTLASAPCSWSCSSSAPASWPARCWTSTSQSP